MAYAGTAPVLETERLWLRPLKEEDAGHFEALFRADWEAVKQTGRMPYPPTAATLQVWIRGNLAGPGHAFLIRRKPDQAVIGTVGFGGEGAIAEVGYALGRAYWGQGYATEALQGVIAFARQLGFGGLQAYSFVENPASARVLVKAGFVDLGRILREYPKRGGMRRVHHFKKML